MGKTRNRSQTNPQGRAVNSRVIAYEPEVPPVVQTTYCLEPQKKRSLAADNRTFHGSTKKSTNLQVSQYLPFPKATLFLRPPNPKTSFQMLTRSSAKMSHLSKAKTEDSTRAGVALSCPAGIEIASPRRSVKNRKQVADFQTKNPKKFSGDERDHRDMPTQKVDIEVPNVALLALGEKAEPSRNPQIGPQASGLETVAMATRLAVARKRQSLCDPMTTAMDKRKSIPTKSQSKPGSVTTSMSTRSVTAKKRPSSVGPTTTAVSTRLAIAKKRQSSSGLVTKAIATCSAGDIKCPTAIVTPSATTRKNEFSSSLVLAENDPSLSDPVTTAKATGLTVTRKSGSGQITVPIAMHLVAAQKSQSLSGPVITATSTQSAVASRSLPSFFPETTGLDTPLTVATTGQSPSGGTTNMKQPGTETTNMEKLVSEEMAKKWQPTCKKISSEKQRRFSVRLIESSSRFKDIVVRKRDGFTHIFLSTKSSENNSLNLEVMKEIQIALAKAAADDSKLVLLSAIGSVFCFGLDFAYFIHCLTRNKKRESTKMAGAVKKFVNTFIQFKKPIIAAVNGPAMGLGASILPLCDMVWANEKAWFQTPYTTFGQSPDGCSSFTFPKVMGEASANEMLLSGRKLTAQEACEKGLVSQVFWPQTFNQEVMIRIKELTSCNTAVLEESKALLRFNTKLELEQVNERECTVLKKIWGSAEGIAALLKYLQKKMEY